MKPRPLVAGIAAATVLANLLFSVAWPYALVAGVAVFIVGEITGRLLPVLPARSPAPVAILSPPGSPHPLSRREIEVAILIAQGLTSKEVGRRLFIERGTVDTHVQHIYNKLQIESRPQLAIWLVDHGLLQRGEPQK